MIGKEETDEERKVEAEGKSAERERNRTMGATLSSEERKNEAKERRLQLFHETTANGEYRETITIVPIGSTTRGGDSHSARSMC